MEGWLARDDPRAAFAALLRILGTFGERYRAAKRSAGVMGFRDAAVCAVDLLKEATLRSAITGKAGSAT